MGIIKVVFFSNAEAGKTRSETGLWTRQLEADCVKSAGRLHQTRMMGEESPRSHLAPF